MDFFFFNHLCFLKNKWLLLINALLCTPQSSCLGFEKLRKIMLFHRNSTWSETLPLKFDVCCVKLLKKCLLNCIISKPGVVYCHVFLGVDHICISFNTSCEINIAFCILNLANITYCFYFPLLQYRVNPQRDPCNAYISFILPWLHFFILIH